MKKKIFIGSSNEAQDYVTELQNIFKEGGEFEVVTWKDPEVFSSNNKAFLDSLIKQTYLVDFAIFLATKDDITDSREIKQNSPRDNVIFEFGLFLTALGKERCFLVVENGCKIMSDMEGITLKKFKDKGDFPEQIKGLENNFKESKKHIPSLITTGLAYGYYKNFVSKLFEGDSVQLFTIYLNKEDFDPSKFSEVTNLPAVRKAFVERDDKTRAVDYPTTLSVIEDVLHDKPELSEREKSIYREREIDNFKMVLEKLMENENFKNKVTFK